MQLLHLTFFARVSRAHQQGNPGKWGVAHPGFDGSSSCERDNLLAHRHALLSDKSGHSCGDLTYCESNEKTRRTNYYMHDGRHHQPEETTPQGRLLSASVSALGQLYTALEQGF